MAFVKGKKLNTGVFPLEGYFNTDHFDCIEVKDGRGAVPGTQGISVCGYTHVGEGAIECILIRDGFPTKEEAEGWLLTKSVEWGIVLVDPNH